MTAQHVGKFFSSVYINRDLEEVPSGRASLQQISAWDTACHSTHTDCWSSKSKPLLPTRVIDVGMENGTCYLFESTGLSEHYIALSHTWGTVKILTTKMENLKRHKENIEFKLLPKTFQEAIEVTRHLGIRYLWIDSLCIVQDDLDDWARESSKMASIYRNSYLTMAATAAKDGSEGLFKSRDVEIFRSQISEPTMQSSGRSAVLKARRARKHDCLRSQDSRPDSIEHSEPLMERGWAFQERLLSRRLVHFASDEMIWECQQTAFCECDSVYRDVPADGLKKIRNMADRSAFEELISGNANMTDIGYQNRHWEHLVGAYTLLNITKDEDRLPAFSGIASTLFDAQDYMAGIRKNHAARDLLWGSRPHARRSQSYLAPTWSWASLIGGIYFPPSAKESRILIDIIDIFAVPSTVDPFGKVKEAEIRIRGYCLSAKVLEKDHYGLTGPQKSPEQVCLELPSVTDMILTCKGTLDTAMDVQLITRSSVTLLAMVSEDFNLEFLILAEQSSFQRKLVRTGKANFLRIGIASLQLDIYTTENPEGEMRRQPVKNPLKKILTEFNPRFVDLTII